MHMLTGLWEGSDMAALQEIRSRMPDRDMLQIGEQMDVRGPGA